MIRAILRLKNSSLSFVTNVGDDVSPISRLTKVFSFLDLHRLSSDRSAMTTRTIEQILFAGRSRFSVLCSSLCFPPKVLQEPVRVNGFTPPQTDRTMQAFVECFA